MEQKNELIQKTLEKIIGAKKNENWDQIILDSVERRLTWYKNSITELDLQGSDVKRAYTLLLVEYLGLKPKEIPIVKEDSRKIVWRSYNWCPVLEACKRGGFDTKEVCKKGWERSVQVLIEKINPNLRFSRNYSKIRPYTEFCEEIIELKNSNR
ncbi:MAG: hypothetical protein ACFFB3_18780 [Candidatus Hodarchaeota archaeon]